MIFINILIACEESQTVLSEFLKLGHNVYSCDLEYFSGTYPERHICGDVLPLLNGNCQFITLDGVTHYQVGKWDLIIAFPPCTYLTFAGNRCFSPKFHTYDEIVARFELRVQAEFFFLQFLKCNCDKVCIENPKGIINSSISPSMIVQPYEFMDEFEQENYFLKTTCLWLKGLPPLVPTNLFVSPNSGYTRLENKKFSFTESCNHNSITRSKTFISIARAMARCWG